MGLLDGLVGSTPVPEIKSDTPHYEAIGRFVTSFATAEAAVHMLARKLSLLPDAKARIIFGGMRLPDLAEIVRQMARLDALPDDQYQEIDECLTQLTDIATKRHNLVHRTSNVFDGKLMVTNIMTSKVINASQTEVFEVEEMSNMQSDCGRIYLRLSHIAKPTKSKLDEDLYNAVRMAPWRYKHVPPKTPNLKSRDKSSKTPRAPNASRAARRKEAMKRAGKSSSD
jgi:hypothetical protein